MGGHTPTPKTPLALVGEHAQVLQTSFPRPEGWGRTWGEGWSGIWTTDFCRNSPISGFLPAEIFRQSPHTELASAHCLANAA